MNFDGKFEKVYIIAEMSANHGRDLEKAKQIIKEAKNSGADAVKIQTFKADTVTIDAKNDYFKIKGGTLWDEAYLYDLYEEASLPWEWHKELFDLAKELEIDIFSTPTDKSSVDFLETLDCPIYKIASFEITDIPLIKYVASKQKPIIISTGIASLSDIELAVETCKSVGNSNITLLKCTSEYPAKYEDMNLATIPNLAETFGVTSGLSDHTKGYLAPVVATTLGAKVIEKHFIIDENDESLDKEFSLTKDEFKLMVEEVRNAEKLLGKVSYSISEKSQKSKQFARSIFVSNDIKKGETFTENNIKVVRPSDGLHPKYFEDIIGKVAKDDIKKGEPLSWQIVQ
jgi:pseudaminic acid synthase